MTVKNPHSKAADYIGLNRAALPWSLNVILVVTALAGDFGVHRANEYCIAKGYSVSGHRKILTATANKSNT